MINLKNINEKASDIARAHGRLMDKRNNAVRRDPDQPGMWLFDGCDVSYPSHKAAFEAYLYRELTGREPRKAVDRSTFNYGRALGPMRTAEYAAMERTAQALRGIAGIFSAASWKLDMALKAIRDSETHSEQQAAMATGREAFHIVDRDLEQVHIAPLRFFRYGRIGDVLRTFNPFTRREA